MSLFGNYNTPGRGVLKAPQEKKGIFKFLKSMAGICGSLWSLICCISFSATDDAYGHTYAYDIKSNMAQYWRYRQYW